MYRRQEWTLMAWDDCNYEFEYKMLLIIKQVLLQKSPCVIFHLFDSSSVFE